MWRPRRPRAQTAADHPGIALCRYVTVRTDIGGVSRTLTAAGTRALTWAAVAQSSRSAAFQAGGPRPPRCLMISAESAESRPSPLTRVASRAWTRRPAAKSGRVRGAWGGAGHEAPRNHPGRGKITVQLEALGPEPLTSVSAGQAACPARLGGAFRAAAAAVTCRPSGGPSR